MLRSYLSIALRHLVSQKLYSAINILGLAVGLACFILIAVFVQYELSYDRHYENADRIYRIQRDFYPVGRVFEQYLATMAPAAAERLELDFPQIEQVVRIACCGASLGTGGDASFYEKNFALADPTLFDVFDYEWLRGDPARALAEPYTIVLTESAARKYFGNEDAMGQTLIVDGDPRIGVSGALEVTGVIRDLPNNTHLKFDMIASLLTRAAILGEASLETWGANMFHTYALLEEGADIEPIQRQSAAFFNRHMEEGSGEYTGFTAIPLTDIHLRSHREAELGTPGSIATVYAFAAIAVFILLIACINFMNLATARSAQRAREVGVRKVVGAERRQIVVQFVGESVLLALLAAALAVAAVELLLPVFSTFLGVDLAFGYLANPYVAALLALLTLAVGLVAGSYPAIYLSAFEPARVLKGDITRGRAAATVRKVLVTLQFAISIALLTGTAVVYQQDSFARNVERGYDKDRIVVITASGGDGVGEQWESLKREWLANPEIMQVTASNLLPLQTNSNGPLGFVAEAGDREQRNIPVMFVDFEFFETYGIDVVAGRAFSQAFGRDRLVLDAATGGATQGNFVLNERAARELGWTAEEAVGKRLEVPRIPGLRGEVVGVVADVLESVRTPPGSTVYLVPSAARGPFGPLLTQASLLVTGRNLAATLDHIDAKWREIVGAEPVGRRFLDDDFQALYQNEQRQARMLSGFSALAIFIACLGLFGLASFMTERRTKEIGVRKALGGSLPDIVGLFTTEFTKLVLLASLIAWPIAYFMLRRWLDTFAYRIDMSLLVFTGATLTALAVAWLTVGGVAARAAAAKPVNALRYE
jgi:putative ABC transport system permease protein